MLDISLEMCGSRWGHAAGAWDSTHSTPSIMAAMMSDEEQQGHVMGQQDASHSRCSDYAAMFQLLHTYCEFKEYAAKRQPCRPPDKGSQGQ